MGLPNGLITGCTAKLPGVLHRFPDAKPARAAAKPRSRRPKLPPPPEETVIRQIAVRLPLPPEALSPNWGSWGKRRFIRSKAIKSYRSRAADEAKVAMLRAGMRGCFRQAVVQIFAWYALGRRRDKDNLIASLKSGFDGLADAGVVANDADMTYLPPVMAKGKKPSILLVIKRSN